MCYAGLLQGRGWRRAGGRLTPTRGVTTSRGALTVTCSDPPCGGQVVGLFPTLQQPRCIMPKIHYQHRTGVHNMFDSQDTPNEQNQSNANTVLSLEQTGKSEEEQLAA